MEFMKPSLLYKTLRVYWFYAIAVLLISAPVFYWAMQHMQLKEADEVLRLKKHQFESSVLPELDNQTIKLWYHWNGDIRLTPAAAVRDSGVFANSRFLNEMDNDMEPYRVYVSNLEFKGVTYQLAVRSNVLETHEFITSLFLTYILILLLLIFGVLLLTRWYSKKLWKPFYQILEKLESYDLSKTETIQFAETQVKEFESLKQDLEVFLTKNANIYREQKEFVENAAHELQTPLAILQTQLESAIQGNIDPNSSKYFEKMFQILAQMRRFQSDLLLLSNLENFPQSAQEDHHIGKLIKEQWGMLESFSGRKNLAMEMQVDDNIAIKSNRMALELCISNLLRNAILHNVGNGKVLITASNTAIKIGNTGQPNALDDGRIFRRFQKGSASGSGAGLGLAIVKKIADKNKWDLQYRFEENYHCFYLIFKLNSELEFNFESE